MASAAVTVRRRLLVTLLSRQFRSTALLPPVALRTSAEVSPRGVQIPSPIPPAASRLDLQFSDLRRFFSGGRREDEESEAESEGSEDDVDDEGHEVGGAEGNSRSLRRMGKSGKTEAEKLEEAAEIGYKVVGSLEQGENPFKPYEPVFAVVQIGSHQFKVSNGDSIFTEWLKYCEVNDKLILKKVLMLGSKSQTMIGRPVLADAAVHAVVEEHALDAKVIVFKKKRRKNYRRTKGHRQELTKLRITDIQGIDELQSVAVAA